MTGAKPSGRRRADRVLSADFDQNLDQIEVSELRARRREAEAEEQELSYVRRLLHGRIDILRAELRSRAGHGPSVLDSLPHILADTPHPATEVRYVPVRPPASGETERMAQFSAVETGPADLHTLTDRELRGIIASLENHERSISESRSRVHRVLDHLSRELTRRYREGTAQVDDLLASVRRH